MKKFVVERNLPGAGNLTVQELKGIAQASNKVIHEIGNNYQWVESFVTEDKIYCIHLAESEEDIREHARRGNFPVNSISEVKTIIDPLTGNT
ncbi:MAG: DUF4242 domain-containing protein [Chitinophagaceae bacterium]